MYIDTHAHLFLPNYNDDLEEVLDRAKKSGINYILVPATDIPTSVQAVELAEKYDMIYAAVGVHPHETKEWTDDIIKDGHHFPRMVSI